jgi:hypothetical protein
MVLLLAGAVPVFAEPGVVDPMRPPNVREITSGSTAVRHQGWIVSEILISPGRQLAVVNGHIVKVGNVVNGARVNAIYGNAVELVVNGESVLVEPVLRDIKQQSKR